MSGTVSPMINSANYSPREKARSNLGHSPRNSNLDAFRGDA